MATSPKKPATASKTAAKLRKPAAKKPVVLAKVTPISVPHQQIAELAHHFWTERGGAHGHDAEDWFRAEQELRAKAS